jgi:hypothetical protein
MMKWLTGVTFAASCSNNGNVWSCPLREADGTKALIVWNPAGNSRYKPGSQYVDYKYFNGTPGGATKYISSQQSTAIGVVPIMFESGQ